uniref:Baculoviral IAP repeat containing 5a n=1 Tax=Gadus morhua TaxID=8049 RepID=A0A8C5F448_GADMO
MDYTHLVSPSCREKPRRSRDQFNLRLTKKMAEAGFLHTPSDNCPDVAKCFFCLKELEGWEPEDDPAAEHRSHSSKCPFINLKKEVEALSVEEFLKLEKERDKYINNKVTGEAVSKFEEGAKLIRAAMKSASGDK